MLRSWTTEWRRIKILVNRTGKPDHVQTAGVVVLAFGALCVYLSDITVLLGVPAMVCAGVGTWLLLKGDDLRNRRKNAR